MCFDCWILGWFYFNDLEHLAGQAVLTGQGSFHLVTLQDL